MIRAGKGRGRETRLGWDIGLLMKRYIEESLVGCRHQKAGTDLYGIRSLS